jgi:hypothetical protein
MRGRQKGRATKRVALSVDQSIPINRTGLSFSVWRKWKRKRARLGTLTVSVGGVRWRPAKGRYNRWRGWDQVAEWWSDAHRA